MDLLYPGLFITGGRLVTGNYVTGRFVGGGPDLAGEPGGGGDG
jgi:hypothetical protein